MKRAYGLSLAVLLGATAVPSAQQQAADPQLVARARAIHDRVITLDTHDDINVANFTPECNYTQRLTTQVNLPKMTEGGLDVAFFIVYVGQGPLTPAGYDNAYAQAVAKFDAVQRLTKEIAPDQIELALTPAGVRRIVASGKKVAVIGIENGYPIGTDVTRVEEFYNRGGRYMSLAHNGHSQLADSNTGEATGEWLHNGLSDLGKQVIAEMNRLGMMIDISHPSKQANLQTMALSKAPVMASHSSARAMGNHSRNLDDEELAALRKNGGVVQTVAFAGYVNVTPPERARETARLNAEFGLTQQGRGGGQGGGRGAGRGEGPAAPRPCPVEGAAAAQGPGQGRGGGRGGQNTALEALAAGRRAEYDRRLAVINAKYPVPPRATVSDFVDHIDYLVKTIGIDHVGISSDFDGGGGVIGWMHAGESPNVTIELVRRGYTEEQIGKLWSGNLLRVWEQVEKAAGR
ncbi:MAG TPA: dipeptidase [Vicinamibacterales bacterium]|nr:dipeptidase [Vicinamibacterales bacterium]